MLGARRASESPPLGARAGAPGFSRPVKLQPEAARGRRAEQGARGRRAEQGPPGSRPPGGKLALLPGLGKAAPASRHRTAQGREVSTALRRFVRASAARKTPSSPDTSGACSWGTLVNNIKLPRGQQLELSDGDLLTFGPKGPLGASPPEFYFMFQHICVQPQDFAAITNPRARGESEGGGGFWPMLPPQGAPQRPLSTLSPTPKATLILSSIGSLSKLLPQPLTFTKVGNGGQSLTFPVTLREAGATLPTPPPAPRNRRKSAHKVLAELEDEEGIEESSPRVQAETRKKPRGMKTPVTPSGKRRGRPRKYMSSQTSVPPPIGGGDPCAAPTCQPPQEETVAWVQCDGCDAWFHVACAGCSYWAAQKADYRCSSCQT